MKNKLIILLVLGIIFILSRFNPSFDTHISMISSDFSESSSVAEKAEAKIREGLDYKNFVILSITQDKGKLSLITVGAVKRVIVVDDEWAKNFINK